MLLTRQLASVSERLKPTYLGNGTITSVAGHILSILLKETRVCVCVFAKLDQFLPVRSQFDSNQHVNSVRIATFQSPNFGPFLFAFYCALLFYENKIKNE